MRRSEILTGNTNSIITENLITEFTIDSSMTKKKTKRRTRKSSASDSEMITVTTKLKP